MSSRTSPALLPDPKRPRLLDDETSSTPAVPSGTSNGLAPANYTGRTPAPTQAVPICERVSYPATQKVTGSSAESSSAARSHAAPSAGTLYPSSSPSHFIQAPPRRLGPPFADADVRRLVTFLGRGLPDIVIAALLDRTPEEVQREIRGQMFWHDGDMADGPQNRPPYTPADYRRLLEMHRCGESAERIGFVLGRSTSSVINHFRKHKPIWLEAGEQVEPEWLLRDKDIDYDDRIQKELASSAADTVAKIAKAHLAAVTRPAPAIPSGSPSTSGSSLPAGTAKSAETSGATIAKPLFPDFKFGKDAPAPRSTASSEPSRPPPAKPLFSQFKFGNDAPPPPRSTATAQSLETSRLPPAKPVVPPFVFGNDAPPPPRLSATAPTPTPAAAAAPPKVNLLTMLRPSTSTSVADSPANLPAAPRTVAASAPALPSTGFLAKTTSAAAPPKVNLHIKLGQPTSTSVVDPPIKLPAPTRTATTSAPAPMPSSTGFSAYSTADAAPPRVNLFAKLGSSTSTSVVDPRKELPAAARTVAASPAAAPAPSSIGFSAYSTAASLGPIASNSSFPPAPTLVTRPVPTSASLPIAVAPPPVEPALQDIKPAANLAPLPLPTPVPTNTTAADVPDPNASPLSPSSDDVPPSLSPRLPNPVPHHAPHLALLPLWCDGQYEQGMSGLKRFLQLVEGSRKSRSASSS